MPMDGISILHSKKYEQLDLVSPSLDTNVEISLLTSRTWPVGIWSLLAWLNRDLFTPFQDINGLDLVPPRLETRSWLWSLLQDINVATWPLSAWKQRAWIGSSSAWIPMAVVPSFAAWITRVGIWSLPTNSLDQVAPVWILRVDILLFSYLDNSLPGIGKWK